MDPMSGCDIRLVFTFPPKDSTLQYKKYVHLWSNFPCISTLRQGIVMKTSFETRVSQIGLGSFLDINIFVKNIILFSFFMFSISLNLLNQNLRKCSTMLS